LNTSIYQFKDDQMYPCLKKCVFNATTIVCSVFVLATVLHASVLTTNATVDIQGDQLDPPGPHTGPPLLDIRQLSGPAGLGGIFTNQWDGAVPGTGDIRTISAQFINSASDGINYSPVTGPNGGALLAITALSGAVGAGGAVFTAGQLTIVEMAIGASFDRRDPSTWGFGGASTSLATYDLAAPDNVLTGPNGFSVGLGVPAAIVNKSLPTANPGVFNAQLLFQEDPAGNPFLTLETGPYEWEGIYVSAQQTLDVTASGVHINPSTNLDGADLSALNAIAGAASFSNLGGAGTGFATGLGGAPATDYNIGPATTGDLYATLSAIAAPVGAVPEPVSLAVWGLLIVAAGICVLKQKRRMMA
jgi:hypothetical protein